MSPGGRNSFANRSTTSRRESWALMWKTTSGGSATAKQPGTESPAPRASTSHLAGMATARSSRRRIMSPQALALARAAGPTIVKVPLAMKPSL